jgi:hypothetical protein
MIAAFVVLAIYLGGGPWGGFLPIGFFPPRLPRFWRLAIWLWGAVPAERLLEAEVFVAAMLGKGAKPITEKAPSTVAVIKSFGIF